MPPMGKGTYGSAKGRPAKKKTKKKLIRKKKNNVQDRNKTPPRYFNRREIFPIYFKKLFMSNVFVTTSSYHH